jgi:Na+/H+ antiporter NhaD/arsenite permease-like protein
MTGEAVALALLLAAVLVLAELCDREGLFDATGHWMAGASRAGRSRRWPWWSWSGRR